jgi:hypothetical protein
MQEVYVSSLEDKVESGWLCEHIGEPRTLYHRVFRTHGRTRVALACALLLVLAIAIFHTALAFVPGTADDLELLSSVAHTAQPLKYLVGDFGMGPYETGNYGQYRPLHPISLWIVYKIFGVRAFPNQFINLAWQFVNTILVFLLIWRVQKDSILAFMGASLFLVSVHTASPTIWVSDRPNLLVGFALILLLHHAVYVRETGGKLRVPYVLLLCLFGLLSKESGLIVPVMAIVISMRTTGTTMWNRIRFSAIWAAVIVVYFLGRIKMFGTNAFSYSTFGYLFGLWPYSLGSALAGHLRQLALLDNVVKNIVEPLLPIYNEGGGFAFRFDSFGAAIGVGIGALATVLLVAPAMRARLTSLQVDCLCVIVFNAAIHNAIFRYRDLYIAQIAVCVFIACNPLLLGGSRRRAIALATACVLLLVSVVRVSNYVMAQYLWRYNELNHHGLALTLNTFHGKRVDRKLAQLIVKKYRDRNY